MEESEKMSGREINIVNIFMNGMVLVRDGYGEQLDEYQGVWNKKRAAILLQASRQERRPTAILSYWDEVGISLRLEDLPRLDIEALE